MVEIPLPDEAARRKILEIHTRDMPLAEAVGLERFAADTAGWSGAEISALAQEARLLAIRDFVEAAHDATDPEAIRAARVEAKHLDAAFEKVKTRRKR